MPGQFVLFVILRTQRLAGKNFSSDILRVCPFVLFLCFRVTRRPSSKDIFHMLQISAGCSGYSGNVNHCCSLQWRKKIVYSLELSYS